MKIFFSVDKRKRKRGRHRTKRAHMLHHAQEWFWPSLGMKGFFRFVEIRLKRSKGSVHAVALGVASGVFASFTPFIGFHILIAWLLCFLFRGSYIVAALGTLIGNPWTFPFIWAGIYSVGNDILGRVDVKPLPKMLHPAEIMDNFSYYYDAFLWPMAVGGIPIGLAIGVTFYIVIFRSLVHYRTVREAHLKKRRKKWRKRFERAGSVSASAAKKTAEFIREKAKKKSHRSIEDEEK